MSTTFLDTETTYQEDRDGNTDPSYQHPDNFIISVAYLGMDTPATLKMYTEKDFKETVQEVLDRTTLLVCHNMKFDLGWLLSCEFEYTRDIWDTMLVEYVLACGKRMQFDLSSCCKRYGLPTKTETPVSELVGPEGIRPNMMRKFKAYALNDPEILKLLHLKQKERLV